MRVFSLSKIISLQMMHTFINFLYKNLAHKIFHTDLRPINFSINNFFHLYRLCQNFVRIHVNQNGELKCNQRWISRWRNFIIMFIRCVVFVCLCRSFFLFLFVLVIFQRLRADFRRPSWSIGKTLENNLQAMII